MSTKGAVTVVMSFLDLRAPRNHYLHGNTQNPVIKEKKKKILNESVRQEEKSNHGPLDFFFFSPNPPLLSWTWVFLENVLLYGYS